MQFDSTNVQQKFVTKGQFFAMPLCFPSVSTPPSLENCRIASIAALRGGRMVGGVTRGSVAYGFWAYPKAVGGYVVTFPLRDGASDGVKVLEARDQVFFAANGTSGAVVLKATAPEVSDGVQEWSFRMTVPDVALHLPGEMILDAVACGDSIVCATDRRCLSLNLCD